MESAFATMMMRKSCTMMMCGSLMCVANVKRGKCVCVCDDAMIL